MHPGGGDNAPGKGGRWEKNKKIQKDAHNGAPKALINTQNCEGELSSALAP